MSRLSKVIAQSVQLILPPESAKHIVEMIQDKSTPLPSASTISRFKLTLDAAFMLLKRTENQSDVDVTSDFDLAARSFMADSSEQCGTDWMFIWYREALRLLDLSICSLYL